MQPPALEFAHTSCTMCDLAIPIPGSAIIPAFYPLHPSCYIIHWSNCELSTRPQEHFSISVYARAKGFPEGKDASYESGEKGYASLFLSHRRKGRKKLTQMRKTFGHHTPVTDLSTKWPSGKTSRCQGARCHPRIRLSRALDSLELFIPSRLLTSSGTTAPRQTPSGNVALKLGNVLPDCLRRCV